MKPGAKTNGIGRVIGGDQGAGYSHKLTGHKLTQYTTAASDTTSGRGT